MTKIQLSTHFVWSGPMCFTTGKIDPKSLMRTFQWRNRTKHNFVHNFIFIITFDRSDGFQSNKVDMKA